MISTPLDHLPLEVVVYQGNELECERLEDGCRGYAMRKQIVELGADLQDSGWRVFVHDFSGDLADESLPIRGWYWGGICHFLAA